MNLYRGTTVGLALTDTLQEMKEKNELSELQILEILKIFDAVRFADAIGVK